MQRRCERNRKRSKRRAIFCPIHFCYLDSVSQKHPIYADRAEQLQARGLGRRTAMMTIATQTSVRLEGEWLEAFWCEECQENQWYHVRKVDSNRYDLSVAPPELWQRAMGVVDPHGNPSVSEFTRKQSRMVRFDGVKAFRFLG